MEKIKGVVLNHFTAIFYLTITTLFSILLVMLRLKLAQSYFYLFLVWNLFLAGIPYIITLIISNKKNLLKVTFVFWFMIWLLFLPNAPYILTDFKHLRISTPDFILFDIILIGSFSITGILYYLLSLKEMEILLYRYFTEKMVKRMLIFIPFLTGFGIYLGREQRWNSWDILHSPFHLLEDILILFIHPQNHLTAWAMILGIGSLLWMIHRLFKKHLLPTINKC